MKRTMTLTTIALVVAEAETLAVSVAPRIHPDEAVFPQFERADLFGRAALFGEEVVKQALETVAALCKLWT